MQADLLLVIVLLAPLASAGVIALFLRRAPWVAAGVSVLAAGASMVLALLVAANFGGGVVDGSIPWLRFALPGGESFSIDMGLYYDPVAALMLCMVTVVGFLIHVFSLGYMRHDGGIARFFGGLSVFMFSVIGIVIADNLFMIFVFWELVGYSSYALIAHYLHLDEAKHASKKAFIVNRVGDFGFLLGIIFAYWTFGTANLPELAAAAGADPALLNTGMALLLVCGFIGKSAQFPLHVWLPDAMAGPTPVSALIHAATMVAAGIYLLCRIEFLLTPETLLVVLAITAFVALYAGFCALGQTDIKRILAYSTLSQLGYMGVAVGLGYWQLGLFHMITHAFFKALLFLGAGSVIDACHHEQNIFRMGGLLRKMPVTGVTFLIGLVALAGVYLTAGYHSKDAIIEAAWVEGDRVVFGLLVLGVFLTALYMGRLFVVAFLGKPNSEHAAHAKESSLVMTLPLVLLAVAALIGGFEWFYPTEPLREAFNGQLHTVHEAIKAGGDKGLMLGVTSAAWVLGLLAAGGFYGFGRSEDRLRQSAPAVFAFLRGRLWFDEIYNFYVSRVQQRFADIVAFLDLVVVQLVLVRGTAGLVGAAGMLGRYLHVGSLHGYVFWFLAGLIVFALFAGGFF